MTQANAAAAAMLGMPGFVVLAVTEIHGEIETTVQTDPGLVGCGDCGVRAIGHGRREVVVRDVPVCGRRGRVRWSKRIWGGAPRRPARPRPGPKRTVRSRRGRR